MQLGHSCPRPCRDGQECPSYKPNLTNRLEVPMNKNLAYSILIAIAITSLTLTELSAQEVPAAKQKKTIALVGGTIHTVSGDTYENGTIVFSDGKIVSVGKDIEIPEGTKSIEIKDKHVYPGLFEAHSQMGLTEIAAVKATRDFSETGDVNPNAKAVSSVNPENVVIPVTRANGVLLALSSPSGGLVSGKSAILQMDGWTYEDMALLPEAAMQINWPSQTLSPRRARRMSKKDIEAYKKQQAKNLRGIRKLFDQSRAYRDLRKSSPDDQPFDLRLEAMTEVVNGELPMMVRADRAAEIQSAVAFAVEQKVKLIILGGYDAEVCADLLKKHDVPVIISAVYRLPQRSDDDYDASFTLPARLQKAGVKFCISGTDRSETWNARILPYHAGTAVAYGLDVDEAIRAITLYPAQILGVAKRVGSLETGKDATLIVTDGSPLETFTKVEHAFIQGRKIDLSSRHERLFKRYEQRQKQLKNRR